MVTTDKDFVHVSKRLENVTYNDLQDKSVTWHRKCYQDTVCIQVCVNVQKNVMTSRQRLRLGRKSPLLDQPETSNFTRSQAAPFDNSLCIFCEVEATYQNPLHKIATDHAGKA